MKKIFTFVMMACVALTAHANLVLTYMDANGQEVTVDKDMTVNVVSMDPEEYNLELHGTIVSATDTLTIEIARQVTGVLDVCCAAGNCINGNGELTQTIGYKVKLDKTWFTHVEAPDENPYSTTITYTFKIAGEQRVLTVGYYYLCEPSALENNKSPRQGVKRVVNGQIVVEKNGQLYNVLGARID